MAVEMPVSGSTIDGRWRLGAVLGRGAVADVYVGDDQTTGRPVAVKVLRSTDPVALRRFDREIEVLGTIEHPRIVRLLGSGGDGSSCRYIVLEHAAGGSLAQRLTAGPMSPAEVAELAVDLAGALAHAHARGLVHRDLKPANVLLDETGHAQLADFGIAQLIDAETLTATGWGIGTPAYIAPEQLRDGDVGPAADVYSLGLVLLEAAAGERAFPGNGLPAALARLEQEPAIPPGLPDQLASLLRRMTALEPDRRPSAASIPLTLAAPDDGATGLMPVANTATRLLPLVPVAAGDHGGRRWWGLAPVAAAVLLVLVGWSLARDAGPPASVPSPSTTAVVAGESTTTTPAVATTSAPATTAATVAVAPEPPNGDRPGHGNGNGNGRKPRR